MARKILLADDSVTAQNMGRKILTDAGYEVTTVNNGSAALKKIAESLPELIVLDVYMPGYSGLEVCQRLKEARETSRIPVLLTVGKLEPFKPEEARRARADAFIVKPFEASELLTALTKLEDKIVPQPSGPKQGQFAKAWAELEQTGDPKSEKFGDSETGWKNRLSIPVPGQKREEPEPEEARSAKVKDKGEKDKREAKPAEVKPAEALAAPGVPADITAEEVAAIAAAAAAFEEKENPARPEFTVRATEVPEEPAASASAPVAPVQAAESKPVEAKKSEPEPAKEAPPIAAEVATSQSAEKKEVSAPAAEVKTASVDAAPTVDADKAAGPPEVSEKPARETAPAPVVAISASPKWMAKEVTLESGEGTASLEEEMRKATAVLQAATGGADFTAVASLQPTPAAITLESLPEAGVKVEARPEEVPVAVPEPEPVKNEDPVVTVSRAEPEPAQAEPVVEVSQAEPEPAKAESVIEISKAEPEPAREEPAAAINKAEPEPAVAVSKTEPESAQPEAVVVASQEDPKPEKLEPEVVLSQVEPEAPTDAPAAVPVPEPVSAVAAAAAAGPGASLPEMSAAAPAVTEVAATAATETKAGESELAAAWAQWKQIRETVVGSQLTSQIADVAAANLAESESHSASVDEDQPQEKADRPGNPSAIANIVDSVLAELKPKLVEEIAKKLGDEKSGKKKKK